MSDLKNICKTFDARQPQNLATGVPVSYLKNVNQSNLAVWPAMANVYIYMREELYYIDVKD